MYLFFGIFLGIFHIPNFSIFLLLLVFFWIFHIPKVRKKRWKTLEYSIFHLNQEICCMKNFEYSFKKIDIAFTFYFFWNIPGIFHIPKKIEYRCGIVFLEYSWNIPYSKKIGFNVVDLFCWNIPFCWFSYSVEYSVEYSMEYSMEYSIFHEFKIKCCDAGA